MKTSVIVILTCMVGAQDLRGDNEDFLNAIDQAPAGRIAYAARFAAIHHAYGDFWLSAANALNELDSGWSNRLGAAWVEFLDQLALAQTQYEERILAGRKLGEFAYAPIIDPTDFTVDIRNNYHPIIPGRVLIYEGQREEGLERKVVEVTNRTVHVDGVECRVVEVTETIDGVLIEETLDWYSQKNDGDVWYFGEIAKAYEDGFLSTLEGSWRSGIESAKAGRVMLGSPKRGDVFRQEFLLNTAEDLIEVVALNATVTVAAGTFTNCIVTEESSALEPEDDTRKYYAPDIGVVLELDLGTGERLELKEIRR